MDDFLFFIFGLCLLIMMLSAIGCVVGFFGMLIFGKWGAYVLLSSLGAFAVSGFFAVIIGDPE